MDDLLFDQIMYTEYMDDLNYSQGFYITPPEDGSVLLGGIRRVAVGEYSDDHRYRKAECAAKFAVEEHNSMEGRSKDLLKFLRIINLNVEPSAGAVYYITMAAADASAEARHYQVKVWEKINSGYQVQMFRLAPYWIKSSDKFSNKYCCIGIRKLKPWMDESYIYYKCFYRASKELVGVEVFRHEEKEEAEGFLWFTNCAETKKILKDYVGKKMPHSNIFYDFDSCTCFRSKY